MADNQQGKEYGVKVGKKFNVKFFRKGRVANKNWCIINYDEGYKDQAGNYKLLQAYTLKVNDIGDTIDKIKEGCEIEITKINGVNFTNNTYTDRTGRNITKRVCNILCDVQVNGSQPIQEQPQFQDSSADTPFATDDNGVSGKPDSQLYFDDIDDINLPF